ncbi:MAG: ATP-dependent DNA helicase RecG [Bdellovibrionales bacterium]|nr:ATP-dependent DNA helicase RecG [Bdellovibrionales bacterium]
MSEQSTLGASIQSIRGVGPKLSKTLNKKGIQTLEDALYFLPRTYEDRRQIVSIASVRPGMHPTLLGTVLSSREIRARRTRRFEVVFGDDTGRLTLLWFHAFPSLASEFEVGARFLIYGEVKIFGGRPQIVHPEYERVKDLHEGKPRQTMSFGRIVPIYSETDGLHQKTIRKLISETLQRSLPELEDPLPFDLRERLQLPDIRSSFYDVHFPKELPSDSELAQSLRRIIFEEFFVLQLGLGLKKRERTQQKAPCLIDSTGLQVDFIRLLPFQITEDQALAISDITSDLARPYPMARLVQGDVGSGKTIVAFAAAALTAAAGYQIALMVPTEILALQHFKNAEQWLAPLGIRPALLVQSTKKEVLPEVQSGKVQFVVGTHALFQKGVEFLRLGLVIVDEQHRFGVDQRNQLTRKGASTHLLMMTATPIPRTLALTLYGDLDLSLIRQKPKGRIPIETRVLREPDRPRLFQTIRKTVQSGQQVYIIYPLVEASEKLDLKSATEMYARLQREVFPDLKLGLLHGRMKGPEKEAILKAFKNGEFQILVSTTVIEVGIDVPQATLMVIEHPERLGLSQLHQLRGRVGRGSDKSHCLLMSSGNITRRLRVMCESEDGFRIAEEDLKIRGPGEFLGLQQSGLPGFRVGHIVRDATLLATAQREATQILDEDPMLSKPEHQGLRHMVEHRWSLKLERLRSG